MVLTLSVSTDVISGCFTKFLQLVCASLEFPVSPAGTSGHSALRRVLVASVLLLGPLSQPINGPDH